MDKTFLVAQLGEKLRQAIQRTHASASEAREDARSGASRAVNLARGQLQRSTAAREELDALDTLHVRPLAKHDPITLGAVVEVENDDAGRTLFLAPVGAGEELTGPDGDGYFQVVTPQSPFGKALLGKRQGEVIEVPLQGDVTEWTITFVA